MHMGYSLTDLIGDVVQMSYVDYSDKGSVRRYNKLASRAAEYWLGKYHNGRMLSFFILKLRSKAKIPM